MRGNFQRDSDGRLSKYAWPGGYPILYLTKLGDVLCADCANETEQDRDHYDPVEAADVHWEGDPLQCDGCSNEIESAYGPIEEAN